MATSTPDDIKKLQSEMQQLRNQQFLLGTASITAFALSAWIIPRPTMISNNYSLEISNNYSLELPALASVAILILLGLMLSWTRILWEIMCIISYYIELRSASEWETDFRDFQKKNKTFTYQSQSRAIAYIYIFLGVLVLSNYLSVLILSGSDCINSLQSCIASLILELPNNYVTAAFLIYFVISLYYGFAPRNQEKIKERWIEVLGPKLINTTMQRFPNLSQEELLTMMDIKLNDWKNSRVYREVKDEGKLEGKLEGEQIGIMRGKLEAVPPLLQRGFAIEEIAQILGLTAEQVKSVQL